MGIVIGTKPDIPENIQPYRAVLLKQLSLAKKSALIRCDVVRSPIGSIQKSYAWLPTIGQAAGRCLHIRDQ